MRDSDLLNFLQAGWLQSKTVPYRTVPFAV